ncbi:3-oxoacyl-[acyl-carrier-protein] synthase I, partial [Nymphaea thermarum]
VNYINAHATSTLAGDLAEVNAIKKVFKKTSQIKMNATKNVEPALEEFDTVPNNSSIVQTSVEAHIYKL